MCIRDRYPCYELAIDLPLTDSVGSLCCCRRNSYGFQRYINECYASFILINAEVNQQHYRGDMHKIIGDQMTI